MHRIMYTDPTDGQTYELHYEDSQPADVIVVTPVEKIPFRALEILMAGYRLHVYHDIFEHWPVPE